MQDITISERFGYIVNKIERTALMLGSLSVYKGILNRTVPKAFYKLLCSYDAPPKEFLSAWGEFFFLLCERNYSDNLCGCITATAFYDENCFSRAAAAKKEKELPPQIIEAARRDVQTIVNAGSLTPEGILSCYKYKEDISGIIPTLPRWGTGTPVEQTADISTCIEKMADFYRENGCGMFARYKAFIWRDGNIEPVLHPDTISLEELKGYQYPRGLVVNNTEAFVKGESSNNCLLYGDKGTGKSSTVKAILNKYCKQGLRIVEMPKERLCDFPLLVDKIAALPMKFIIFIDDLSFQKQDTSYASLKAVLEGGLAARPSNTLIYATSNRRHLVKESFSDRDGDDLHRNDTIQESLSLFDRFGLAVNFSAPTKDKYLEIVKAIAQQKNIDTDEEKLFFDAEQWALERGGRSPRCARQFIDSLSSKHGKNNNGER